MLDIINLACTRGDRTLFRNVSFKLDAGGLLHVAGENGSGKTSLLRILCGLGAADEGEVHWRGESIRTLREAYRREIVYLGHANALKEDLSTYENLRLACALAGQPTTDDVAHGALSAFGLAACEHLPVRSLSQGQKRRSALARLSLSTNVPLWILDEPFTALDAAAVKHMEQLIVGYLGGGGSVIFTTHQDAAIASCVTQRVDLDPLPVATC
jgi:heme exporter protein A